MKIFGLLALFLATIFYFACGDNEHAQGPQPLPPGVDANFAALAADVDPTTVWVLYKTSPFDPVAICGQGIVYGQEKDAAGNLTNNYRVWQWYNHGGPGVNPGVRFNVPNGSGSLAGNQSAIWNASKNALSCPN